MVSHRELKPIDGIHIVQMDGMGIQQANKLESLWTFLPKKLQSA